MNKTGRDEKIDRLEKLKQATILNYGEGIDFNNEIELYENMLIHVFNGDFNESFLTDYIDEVDDKESVIKLANKYMSLCFYQGSFEYWLDSIEGVSLSDLDIISLKLLDNYDFLLRIANSGGEDALKELLKFQRNDAFEGESVIDHLRNVFDNDNVLEHVIIEMTRKDGAYSSFTDYQKIALCSSPSGIIFDVEGNKVYHTISIIDTLSLLKHYVLGDETDEYSDEDFTKILKGMSKDEFEDILYMIQTANKEKNSDDLKK